MDETVHDFVEDGIGAEPVLMEVDKVRTRDEPVLESVAKELGEQVVGTREEPVPEAVKE